MIENSETSASATSVTTEEYIELSEAAARLKRSERAVQDMVKAGKLHAIKQENPATHKERLLVDAGDVAKMLADREAKALKPVPSFKLLEEAASPRPPEAEEATSAPSPTRAPCEPWQCMTIDEAAVWLRAPRSVVEQLILAESLPAAEATGKVKGGWLILRRDLEAVVFPRHLR